MAAVPVCDLNIAGGNCGRARHAVPFPLFTCQGARGRCRVPGGPGSGAQDAGVLGDCVVQVGGGDREGDAQVLQAVVVRGGVCAGGLRRELAREGAGQGGRPGEQVGDLPCVPKRP
jgi:hypothetical protein